MTKSESQSNHCLGFLLQMYLILGQAIYLFFCEGMQMAMVPKLYCIEYSGSPLIFSVEIVGNVRKLIICSLLSKEESKIKVLLQDFQEPVANNSRNEIIGY